MSEQSLKIYINKEASRSTRSMAAMHMHRSHELYFLLAGRRRYFIGHNIYEISPGNLVFIPKDTLHRTTASGRMGYERYVVNFFEPALQGFIDRVGRAPFETLLHSGCLELPPDINRRIRQDLEEMERESKNRCTYTNAAIVHLLEDILLCALRHGKPAKSCVGETVDKIQYMARYISENYAEPLTLEDAAQLTNLEKTYFSKRFKLLTGFGFHEYLTEVRLCAAAHLLEQTNLNMVAIAERCGFSNSNYFGDVFRQWKSISPSQYRSVHRKSL